MNEALSLSLSLSLRVDFLKLIIRIIEEKLPVAINALLGCFKLLPDGVMLTSTRQFRDEVCYTENIPLVRPSD